MEKEYSKKECSRKDAEIFRLSNSFLNDTPYQAPDFGIIDPEGAYIIRQAIKAGNYIDELPPLPKV